MDDPTHRWSPAIKRLVVVTVLVLAALVVYRFRAVVSPLALAFLLAFILDPIVDFLTDRLHLGRGLATALVFLVLILGGLALVATPVTILPSPIETANTIQEVVTNIIAGVGNFVQRPLVIGDYTLELGPVYHELSTMLRSYIRSVIEGTLDLAVGIASGALWLIFVLVAAFYIVKDVNRLVEAIDRLAPPNYRDDVVRLRLQVRDVWSAFLRGQLLLALGELVITTAVLGAVGVPYAWVMGLLAGVMEFVPNIGPFIAAAPAILVAFLQGSTFLPISRFWFGVLVTVLYIAMQQFQNNVLVPRILGGSLRLHPLVVLVAIVVGGILGGILGMLIAAPILATLRILGHYVLCQIYDRDPFAPVTSRPKPSSRKSFRHTYATIWRRLQRQRAQPDSEPPAEAVEQTRAG